MRRCPLTLLIAALAAASFSGVAVADGSVTFVDPTGDVQPVDVTAVTIGDRAAGGSVSVSVTATGFGPGSWISVPLDTDLDHATPAGQGLGAEYGLTARSDDRGELSWDVVVWADRSWRSLIGSAPDPIGFTRTGDVFTWTLSRADLGRPTAFYFFVQASGAPYVYGGANRIDYAPDTGWWLYDLEAKPEIGTPRAVPALPTAGKQFSLGFPVARSDTGKAVASIDSLSCDPVVLGGRIAHVERFESGIARVSFTIPKRAKGKLLTVKVTVMLGTHAATRVATFRVR